jgi:hypothetical protein
VLILREGQHGSGGRGRGPEGRALGHRARHALGCPKTEEGTRQQGTSQAEACARVPGKDGGGDQAARREAEGGTSHRPPRPHQGRPEVEEPEASRHSHRSRVPATRGHHTRLHATQTIRYQCNQRLDHRRGRLGTRVHRRASHQNVRPRLRDSTRIRRCYVMLCMPLLYCPRPPEC